MKLRKRKTNTEPPDDGRDPGPSRKMAKSKPPVMSEVPGAGPSVPEKKKKMTAAERQRAYRQRVKNDPEKYKKQKEYDQLRCKLWRARRGKEQKQRDRDLCKARCTKYRAKQKESGKTPVRPKRTRKSTQEQAAKWREAKKKQRAAMSSQKRRRVNERRRAVYAQKKAEKKSRAEQEASLHESSPFPSDSAKRKAVSRSWRVLPRSPRKFAEVMSSVVHTSTPKRKAQLKKRCILSPAKKKQLVFFRKNSVKKVLHEIRKKRSARYSEVRNLIRETIVVKNKVKKKTARKHFGMSWNFLSKKNQGIRKKRSDSCNPDLVRNFFQRPDISRELPCRGTKNAGKRVMECTYRKAYSLFCEEFPSEQISFSLFYKLKPNNIKPIAATKLMQCLCEYCVNIAFLLKTLSAKALQSQIKIDIHSKYDAVNATLCCQSNRFPRRPCIDRTCEECGTKLLERNLQQILEYHGQDEVKWREWSTKEQTNGPRMALVERSGTLREMVGVLKEKLEPFAKHLTNARWQAIQFQDITTSNLPDKCVVFCMDFAENFNCHFQDEAQSAHWCYKQATLHSTVAYYHCKKCPVICKDSIMVISNDKKHDQHAVQHFVGVAVEHLRKNDVQINQIHQFSDGSPVQYKSKMNFADMSLSMDDFGFPSSKHFFGSRHGKGPCDGEFGVVKRVAFNAVKSRQTIISDAKDLYDYLTANHTLPRDEPKESDHPAHQRRTFFFIEEGSIDRERGGRTGNLKPVKETRLKHEFTSVRPYEVRSRERSCFCTSCLSGSGECPNKDFIGSWETTKIKDAEHRKPECGTQSVAPPVQTSSPGTRLHSLQQSDDSNDGVASISSETGPSISDQHQDNLHIEPGDFAAVILKSKNSSCVFMAEVSEVMDQDVQLRYMKKSAGDLYIWPAVEDTSWENKSCLLCKVRYPELANKREQFRFLPDDMSKVRKCLCSRSVPFH